MKFSFIIKLAIRDLKGYKLRSLLTIGGVAIGIGFIVFLLSLGFGLERLTTSKIQDIEALRMLDVASGKSKIVKINNDAIDNFDRLGTLDKIIPSASMSGKVEYKTSVTDGVIYGKDLSYLALEKTKLALGRLFVSDETDEALINITAAKQLGLKDYKKAIDEKVKVTFVIPSELSGSVEAKSIQKDKEFKIVGIIDNESSPYVYVSLKNEKGLGVLNYNNLKVRVKDKEKIDLAKKQIENIGYKVTALKDTVSQVNQFFVIFKFILVGFGIIAMIVASLGMFNTLTVSLLEKTREVGLLKVLGTTNNDIYKIFLTQSLSIGFFGGIMGVLSGYTAGSGVNFFIYRLAERTGNEPVSIFYAPSNVIIIIFVFSIVISFLTGLYPSRRASKISALNALRYE